METEGKLERKEWGYMVLTIAFSKGGTGKTSTANSLNAAARRDGKRTLSIDADPQGNLTLNMGGNPGLPGLYHVLTERIDAAEAIQETEQGDLLSAGLNLTAAEQEIERKPGRDFILRTALAPVLPRYDLIVIDTPPALGSLLVNALSASDFVLLPMQVRTFAIMGLYQIAETIAQVQKYCRPTLSVCGILYTQYIPNRSLSRDLSDSIQEQARAMGTTVCGTYIRPAEAVPQAQAVQQSIFDYAPRSHPAEDYQNLYQELKGTLFYDKEISGA